MSEYLTPEPEEEKQETQDEKDARIASETWELTALRAILQENMEDKREEFWDEQK